MQTRTTEDGTTFAALVVAPRIPGYAPVSVTHLKKIDFLKDVKARGTDPGATGWFNNVFRVAENIYSLRVENVFQEDGNQFFGTAQMIRDEFVPDVFTSDDWVVFDCAVPQGSDALEVKFSNGTISAKANIQFQGDTATVSYNDGAFQPPLSLFGGGGDLRPLRIVLPINNNPIFGGVSNEVLREYLGTWTVETTPALTDETFQLPATPFQFDLNALILDEITYQKKPNFVNEQGEEFYGGATFTAKAKIVGPDNGRVLRVDVPQNFACRARVRSLDRSLGIDGVVHEQIQASGEPTTEGVLLTFDWDGIGPGSVRYPAELDFGISIWGLVTFDEPASVLELQNAIGEPAVGGSHSGPPGFFADSNFNLEVSPNPFIPPEEEYIDLDGDGELDWNDYDQDGIPDGWPPEADTDGDGLPDVPPPDPFVTITAEPRKNGYDTKNWVIHVENEEGNQIPDATFMGDTPTAYIEWTPPADLEPQILKVGIHAGLCRNRTLPLTVRAQDGGESDDGCVVAPEVVADLALAGDPYLKISGSNRGKEFVFRSDRPATSEQLDQVFTEGALKLEVIDLGGQIPRAQTTLDLEIQTNKSELAKNLKLQRENSTKFGLSVDLSTELKDFSEPISNDFDSQAFFSLETGNGQAGDLFAQILKQQGQTQIGRSTGTADSTILQSVSFLFSLTDEQNLVKPTRSALRAGGFEAVEVNVVDQSLPASLELSTRFRYKNQAPFLYISSSGDHDTNELSLSSSESFNPTRDLRPNEFSKVRTMILAGSSNLDINDYNYLHPPVSPGIDPNSPGLAWDLRFPRYLGGVGSEGNLLGYCCTPHRTEELQKAVLRDFFNLLGSGQFASNLSETISSGFETVALAWVLANGETDNSGACAITARGYYFTLIERGSAPPQRRRYQMDELFRRDLRRLPLGYVLQTEPQRLVTARTYWAEKSLVFIPREIWSDLSNPLTLKASHLADPRTRRLNGFSIFRRSTM